MFMAARKFHDHDRIESPEEAPASFRGRKGLVVAYKGRGGYGVRFDDRPDIVEYVNSNWIIREGAQTA